MKSRAMIIHALSPLHAGTGQGVGVVDLSIAREVSTGIPYLPGSSIKGALRHHAETNLAQEKDDVWKVFGPDTDNASDYAGPVTFGDAQLVCLPTRSVSGTFAWVTSPYLLHRLNRDLKASGSSLNHIPVVSDTGTAHVVGSGSALVMDGKAYFEDLDFDVKLDNEVTELADELSQVLFPNEEEWQTMFVERLCVVHDDVMSFLALHGTDVVTRVSIDPSTGTAKKGQLWTEENLPPESILVSLVSAAPSKAVKATADELLANVEKMLEHGMQFGGNASIGRGRCRTQFVGGA